MANDSIPIIDDFDYHPCNTPRGCLYYDKNVLTAEQQTHLNSLKTKIMREDETYLNRNPEVGAFVALIIRYVLKVRPRQNVHRVIGEFFARPEYVIQSEVMEYIAQRGQPIIQEQELEDEEDLFNKELLKYYVAICESGDHQVKEEQSREGLQDHQVEEEQSREGLQRRSAEEFIRRLLDERIYGMPSLQSIHHNRSLRTSASMTVAHSEISKTDTEGRVSHTEVDKS